ncbi:hypothetical protein [Singulisphaera acidiphila]|uniref:Uncharacterized protein n=1 Tax=Singulisphaera acidiphila (strain ATCC BAA-1392 / DSM 18658 / VKM B-2454 / MOB10) TaxID=886293 RepID=L0DHZ5_SINAD|nr:hypothetical protein [Singulisphaera acidiphila]AGA28301.1 hypothetical protein Sinac_4086 [Singulisphaera acidiphila DSM 18658]
MAAATSMIFDRETSSTPPLGEVEFGRQGSEFCGRPTPNTLQSLMLWPNSIRRAIVMLIETSLFSWSKQVGRPCGAVAAPKEIGPGPRLQEHRKYLQKLERDGEISTELENTAWRILLDLLDAAGSSLAIPDACPGSDGQLLYTWDQAEHHLELEMFPDRHVEFFYRNRRTGGLWEHEQDVTDGLPLDTIAKLRLFT